MNDVHPGARDHLLVVDHRLDAPSREVRDCPGLCYQAVCATVVRVYDPHVRYDPKYGREMEKVVNELEAAKARRAH